MARDTSSERCCCSRAIRQTPGSCTRTRCSGPSPRWRPRSRRPSSCAAAEAGWSAPCTATIDFLRQCVLAIAPYHGRIYVGSEKVAGQTMGPGTVLPQLLHGGPGHAGGGEELGGLRGLQLYSQRVAIQADRSLLDAIAPALEAQKP